MAKKENILRFPTNLFVFNDGSDAVNSRRWNENNNPLCTVPGCNNTAHNQGYNHGGFSLKCKSHLNLTGDKSYKNHKFDVPYCENKDGRLGFPCTTTIHHFYMLSVDHIDENHDNDDVTNWQTLCACCDTYKSNMIGKKVKSGKLSVSDMLEFFEVNKRINEKTHTTDDMLFHHSIKKILSTERKKK